MKVFIKKKEKSFYEVLRYFRRRESQKKKIIQFYIIFFEITKLTLIKTQIIVMIPCTNDFWVTFGYSIRILDYLDFKNKFYGF